MKTVRYIVTPIISYQITRYEDEPLATGNAGSVETLGAYATAMDASREALRRAAEDSKAADVLATAHFEDEPLRELAAAAGKTSLSVTDWQDIAYGATNLTGGCSV
jgi:hypothetical protein